MYPYYYIVALFGGGNLQITEVTTHNNMNISTLTCPQRTKTVQNLFDSPDSFTSANTVTSRIVTSGHSCIAANRTGYKFVLLIFLILGFTGWLSGQSSAADPTLLRATSKALIFMENKGQVLDEGGQPRADVLFMAREAGIKVAVTANGLSFQYEKLKANAVAVNRDKPVSKYDGGLQDKEIETWRIDLQLLDANPRPRVVSEKLNSYTENYYNLTHAPEGITGVRGFERIVLKEVYPGIDWVIYSGEGGLKYDFVVHPGASPDQIRLSYRGAERVALDRHGRLRVYTGLGELTEEAPVSFAGSRRVRSSFKLHAGVVSFSIGNYDRSLPLVIDPDVTWGTYYGGTGYDEGNSTATDGAGNVYLAGWTTSVNNMSAQGFVNIFVGVQDAFIVKFNAAGNRLWGTYYGGDASDVGYDLTVDGSGNIYLAGATNSPFGIAQGNVHQPFLAGEEDAFVAKFNPNGFRLWGTYYGGAGTDNAYSVAIDGGGNVYLAGETNSTGGIYGGNGFQSSYGGGGDGFVVKLDGFGQRLWGSYYGGSFSDLANSVVVSGSGEVYVCGRTGSLNGIAAGQGIHQGSFAGDRDAFLVKFAASGERLWGTYYGGSSDDIAHAIDLDGSGQVYMTGETRSVAGFASATAHQQQLGGSYDGFVAKFSPQGARVWGTYFGGTALDAGFDLDTDAFGNCYMAGYTFSSNGIAFNGFQTMMGGNNDAMLVKFSPDGNVLWGSYFGSSGFDFAYAIASTISPTQSAYLAGFTSSLTNIALGGHQMVHGGGFYDAYLARIGDSPNCPPPTEFVVTGGGTYCRGDLGVTVGLSGSQTGVTYYLFVNGQSTGTFQVGTGNAISFGLQREAGEYTVEALNPCGTTVTSTSVLIYINNFSAGQIGDDQTICPGETISLLSPTVEPNSNGVLYHQWEVSTNEGLSWIAIPNANATSYQPGALTTTSWFRRLTTSTLQNVNCTQYTNVVVITMSEDGDLSLVCPPNQTRYTSANNCLYTASGGVLDPSVVDYGCADNNLLTYRLLGATVALGSGSLDGLVFPKGSTQVTWTLSNETDEIECSFVLAVADDTPPAVVCPTDQSRSVGTACFYDAVGSEFNPLQATDNCASWTVGYSLSGVSSGEGQNTLAGQPFNVGETVVNWVVTDAEGLTGSCSFTVTVSGSGSSGLVCPASATRQVSAGSCNFIVFGNEFNPQNINVNCGVASISNSINGDATLSGAILPVGENTITWTITNESGGETSCSFVITVQDQIAPVVNCQNATVQFNGKTIVALNTLNLVTASDNCGLASITQSPSSLSCTQLGQTVPVTVTATDLSGNVSSCVSQVTAGGLPCGWANESDGINCANGSSATYNPSNQVYTLTATNCATLNPFLEDRMAYMNRSLCGNGSIQVRVNSVSGTAWAGIVMRENNQPRVRKVQLTTNALNNAYRREIRVLPNTRAIPQQIARPSTFWLRLLRIGNQFVGYVSANGFQWTQVMSATVTMGSCIQMGLVLYSTEPGETATANFSNLEIVSSGGNLSGGDISNLLADEDAGVAAMAVFPNPTDGTFRLAVEGDAPEVFEAGGVCEVYNATGQRVSVIEIAPATFPGTSEPVDLTLLPPGMYFVRLRDEAGNMLANSSLVIY